LRALLVKSLRDRLVGPEHGDSESLKGMRPTENYIAGVLAPQNRTLGVEGDDGLTTGGDEASGEGEPGFGASLSNAYKPSAIGFTCIVDEGTRDVIGRVRAARYVAIQATEDGARLTRAEGHGERPAQVPPDDGADGPSAGAPKQKRSRYDFAFRRISYDTGEFSVPLDQHAGKREFALGRFRVEWRVRGAVGKPGAEILTTTVVNLDVLDREARATDVPEHLFQVELELRGRDGSPFIPRNFAVRPEEVAEDKEMDLLYRDQPAFATGHGCAAEWAIPQEGHSTWIRTSPLPQVELPIVESSDLPGEFLSMHWLAETSRERVVDALLGFHSSYDSWIKGQSAELAQLSSAHRRTAIASLARCGETAARIKAGVDLLGYDSRAWKSFQLMNQVIGTQFAKGVSRKSGSGTARWRPFQLAFILECLPGVCGVAPGEDPVHLLWFPTGGGKTEAYLGLSAFAISYRRLSAGASPGSGGVTVLMRYTLRLLTIQQFQRAASMICSLEALRRKNPSELGPEEISIGLWVGESSTPNRLEEAFRQLQAPAEQGSSPVQLSKCPYCQTRLDRTTSYLPAPDRSSLIIRCPSDSCPFHERLPVYVVDEEIYRRCPTLVIGTVDKFARLAWEPTTRALFGLVESWCSDHGFSLTSRCQAGRGGCTAIPVNGVPPPCLVIQDELHLISGPLGTMVGVYEGLIDFLCRRTEHPPVIIGSSATVRRAEDQCRNLYGRRVEIFPPRALSPTETYFSRQVPLTKKPGRLFLGVLPSGFTVKTTLVRAYSSLLLDRDRLPADPPKGTTEGDKLRDPYFTLVAYFNSLRELGGAVRLAEDDVPAQMRVYAGNPALPVLLDKEELTSRRKGYEIPEILDKVERSIGGHDPPPDLLLATNMISVGVDIRRLSLMAVTGQPKATAEYIQATSRIGREFPGLVVMVYNWARPRDRSHYEDFYDYHATLYRHVEANSVTPYTDPALRRGLHAVLVAAVRLLEPGMSAVDAAGRFQPGLATVGRLRRFLLDRLGDPREPSDPAHIVRERFDSVVDRWAELTRKRGTKLTYQGDEDSLLVPFETVSDQPTDGLPTLNSLREVEPSTGLEYEAS
jgi:hypothetical protein